MTKNKQYLPVLAALGTVAAVVLGVVFIPKLLAIPFDEEAAAKAEYESYRAIYEEAKNYNYAFGGDQKLEKKIKRAVESETSNLAGYYFYLMAAAEYYYGVRDYDRAVNFAEEAATYAPTDDEIIELTDFFLKAYKKLGNEDALAYWQEIYDEYHIADDCTTGGEETSE